MNEIFQYCLVPTVLAWVWLYSPFPLARTFLQNDTQQLIIAWLDDVTDRRIMFIKNRTIGTSGNMNSSVATSGQRPYPVPRCGISRSGNVAQLVECRASTRLNSRVQLPGAARDFSPRVNRQCRLSYTSPVRSRALTSVRTLKISLSLSLSGFLLACEDFGERIDDSFPAYAFLFF